MRSLSVIISLLTISGSLAAQAERPVMAIAPIGDNATVSADERSQLGKALRDAIGKKFGVQSGAVTASHMAAALALGFNCKEGDSDCWRQVRDVSTAQSLVLCEAARVEGNVQVDITIERIGPASNDDGQVAGTITFPISQKRIDELVARLFAIQATVVFAVAPTDAELMLNGAPLVERTKELSPGTYEVSASASGYLPASRTFDVKAGELNSVEIALERDEGSILPYALMGGGGVGLIGGLVLGIVGANYAQSGDFNESTNSLADLSARRASGSRLQYLGLGTATAGVLLAGVGVYLLVGE